MMMSVGSTMEPPQDSCRAAHEMRTPLAALRLELEEALIHRDAADPFAAVEEALHSVERLEHAVIALLTGE